MEAVGSTRRAVTLQCGVFRETTIFEDSEFSVFLELVYFFLDYKVKLLVLLILRTVQTTVFFPPLYYIKRLMTLFVLSTNSLSPIFRHQNHNAAEGVNTLC